MTVYGKLKGRIAERGLTTKDMLYLLSLSERVYYRYLKEIRGKNYSNLNVFCKPLDFEIELVETNG